MIISVTFTKSKFNTKETLKLIDKTDADYLHIDLFDGKFVDTKQQLPAELNKLLSEVKKPLDVHLMAVSPLKYLDFFASQNTEFYTFHYEAVKDVPETIAKIKNTGLKAGIAIRLETDVDRITEFLPLLDQVLVMSCGGGHGGTPFQEIALEKIITLNKLKAENDYSYLISVDGGINHDTIDLVKEAGVNMVASGSYICMSDDYQKSIDDLRK